MSCRSEQRLTRRQQKLSDKGLTKVPTLKQSHFELSLVKPKTANQEKVFAAYKQGCDLFVHGAPGTGKTFLTLYLALLEVLDSRSTRNKIVIVRSSQPSKQIGFLPGDEKKKMEVYSTPYKAACAKLFNRGDAYEILMQKGLIEFESTSFLRGNEFENAILFLDESQNLTFQELSTVLSRAGANTRVVICGDINQDDLTSKRYNEESGLSKISRILGEMDNVAKIEFGVEDIVRSGFVRKFIEASIKLGMI